MNKIIWSKILFGIGIALFVCYIGGLVYFYNFNEYNPYASAGAETDAFIHSVLFLPPTVMCFVSSILLYFLHKNTKNK